MNASAVILCLLVSVLAVVSGFPAVHELQDEELLNSVEEDPQGLEISTEETGLRFRRVTCDILSFSAGGVSLNHSVCAAHCVAKNKGFKGGRCKGGVCHCRK